MSSAHVDSARYPSLPSFQRVQTNRLSRSDLKVKPWYIRSVGPCKTSGGEEGGEVRERKQRSEFSAQAKTQDP